MNTPQSVTDRYINNLLRNGKNDSFELVTVSRGLSSVDNIPVGTYYNVVIADASFHEQVGLGATPDAAARRALEKFGVTFR